MTWLAWRQLRTQAVIAVALLLVIAVALALTGPNLAHLYDTVVRHCHTHRDCGPVTRNFARQDLILRRLSIVAILAPGILGVFWGAPLVARELESGTYRLVWTQSVTRTRWILVKLGLVGLASVLVTGALTLMVTWWSSPLDRLHDAPFGTFDHRDVVPLGYAAFAFALGVTLGVLIRRTVPAMAATLAVFAGVRFLFTGWVRARLLAPLHRSVPLQVGISSGPNPLGAVVKRADWVISDSTINARGQVIGQFGGVGPSGRIGFNPIGHSGLVDFVGVGRCPNTFPVGSAPSTGKANVTLQEAAQRCAAHFHLRESLTYLPVGRFWALQWYECASFFAMALLLAAAAVWRVRRRPG
ncbi:MAG: ABC transporter permease [Acidimicrobiales bacterium]